MRDPVKLAQAAQSLHKIIEKAKLLGVTEIGHQIDPEKITAAELAATESALKDAIRTYTQNYLSLTTTDVLMNYKDLMGLDPNAQLIEH